VSSELEVWVASAAPRAQFDELTLELRDRDSVTTGHADTPERVLLPMLVAVSSNPCSQGGRAAFGWRSGTGVADASVNSSRTRSRALPG
jgi:hypothetical protein